MKGDIHMVKMKKQSNFRKQSVEAYVCRCTFASCTCSVVLVQYVVAVVANQLLKQDSMVLEMGQKILFVMIAEKL